MTLQEKLEWALMTLREKLTFGMDESEAIKRRESRVKGVLLEAVKELPLIVKENQEMKDALSELLTEVFEEKTFEEWTQKYLDLLERINTTKGE